MFAIRDDRDYVVQVGPRVWWGTAGRLAVLAHLGTWLASRRRHTHGYTGTHIPPPPPCAYPVCPQEDFMKAVRKLGEAKKLEGHLAYSADFGDGGKA